FDGSDFAGQNGVDLVEVSLQRGQLFARSGDRRGDAEIEIDMSVDAGQELLHHDRIPARSDAKSELPAPCGLLSRAELVEGVQVPRGKVDIECREQRAVLKLTVGDAGLHSTSDASVQPRKVSNAALFSPCPIDDRVQSADYIIDGFKGHCGRDYSPLSAP